MAESVTGEAMIEAHGLALNAGARSLVKDFDWRAHAGEFWCVLGANGAGKTTLLRALAGLVAPARGEVLIKGRALAQWERHALALERGFVAQQAHDAFDAGVLETALIGRHPHLDPWTWEGAADVAAARAVLARVGLEGYEARSVKTLSGGERQRVSLATLLLQDPRICLLDEPTSHQDVAQQATVSALLRGLAREGRVVIAALHDINLAARYATHALLLDGAGTVSAGPVAHMLTAENLSRIYRHPMQVVSGQGADWFFPQG
ncbi:MAG: iron complex transport system ATP-binding protein [Betaproteobacteria bacterium]|nr:iron complex transport system ATP-binding protein [Betaproteobacteria bacterium]